MLEDFFLKDFFFLSLSESLLKRHCHSQYWRESQDFIQEFIFLLFSKRYWGRERTLKIKSVKIGIG
jgi:hypothetical protein